MRKYLVRSIFGISIGIVLSLLPWWFDTLHQSNTNTLHTESPTAQALYLLGAQLPERQEVEDTVRLLHTDGAFHQPKLYTLTGLCRRTATTQKLFELDATTTEQMLPDGQQVLRTKNLYHWSFTETVRAHEQWAAECDRGSFSPLAVNQEYILWHHPCDDGFGIPNLADDTRKNMVACYRLALIAESY